MIRSDRTIVNGCQGSCLIVTNNLLNRASVEIRITAPDPARPGLAGQDAAVTVCNGAAPLSTALVRRVGGLTEWVSLVPYGQSVVIGKFLPGSVTATYTQFIGMPGGAPYNQGNIRTETYSTPTTSPSGTWQNLQM
jgi:hypothetical protein